ncbi:MAG: beta-1,6-N-acetylglucosaminyltransferase [Flavobacteriales bacterium]
MQHAFLITAYTDLDGLNALIECLGPEAHIFVHLDRKARVPEAALDRLRQQPTLRFLSRRYSVNWGSARHLHCILELCRSAVKDERIDYLHLITGSDHPLVARQDFNAFFEQHRGSEFIEHFPLPTRYWPEGGLDRLTLYHPLEVLDLRDPRQRRMRDLVKMVQLKLGVRRSLDGLPPLHGGSTWWSLSRMCVADLLKACDADPGYLRRFRHTHVPEEIFFQTLIMSSPFVEHVVNDNLRYVDWVARNGNNPAILDLSDLDKVLASGKFFARKLVPPASQGLIDELRRRTCTQRDRA